MTDERQVERDGWFRERWSRHSPAEAHRTRFRELEANVFPGEPTIDALQSAINKVAALWDDLVDEREDHCRTRGLLGAETDAYNDACEWAERATAQLRRFAFSRGALGLICKDCGQYVEKGHAPNCAVSAALTMFGQPEPAPAPTRPNAVEVPDV